MGVVTEQSEESTERVGYMQSSFLIGKPKTIPTFINGENASY